jgi:hypothetical protein
MSYSTADGRRQVLDELATAADQIGMALASLGEAYERMDDDSADRLEADLFRPVQAAYGRAKRAHNEFAARYGLPARTFPQPSSTDRPGDARAPIEHAAEALRGADQTLSTLQDSMLPVEVGDQELRASLAQVRDLIAALPNRSREILRTLGR